MPTKLRNSGPDIIRDGKLTTPMAAVHFCNTCGFEGAAFGERRGDELVSYCGWREGRPVCVGRGKAG